MSGPSPVAASDRVPAPGPAQQVDLGAERSLSGRSRSRLSSDLPSGVVVLTDRRAARRPLAAVVAAAVAGGVRWVVLREKDLPRAERAALAVELRAILAEAGGTLIVAGPDPLDGGAVHLPAAGPYPPPRVGLVGRSCHDEAELRRLTTEDYVTVSPVYPTRSKPGYGPPLYPHRLASLIGRSPVPALALGGVETPEHVTACIRAGATGVAVLGAIMRADNPHQAAATLTNAAAKATRQALPPPAASDEATRQQPVTPSTSAFEEAATPVPRSRQATTDVPTTGLRPTVPTQGSSLTARSGHGRPQPSTATTTAPPGAGE
ncbi:hydroxymethylpyrimidine kinase / phosphomethylpyrimidine kinase / thiamine-phosphate diphosphorylase [Micromonospora avicenniae]|uniref:Hydroxymethylpyrimidine kinase / phosphomethylpyrimidine kinase / thiamine-phosphate diphosphorylase n=1 Tax=Micromonospora avicenniae TaxID=1198245 RepID=A0A1N6Q5G9_9ACTN|nr:hydroxymethylpyrimidine kinase / phosphomethylpyrimidine kinase / thiamine-phosphate diphosphorylase [Micromonospora avicenniae]